MLKCVPALEIQGPWNFSSLVWSYVALASRNGQFSLCTRVKMGWIWPTGRIGSRQQLAENVWLVSLGCSGGPQWYCRDHLHIIQRWFKEKTLILKNWQISLCACENGLDLPHLAKRDFGDQMGPNLQKAMLLGSLSHQSRIFSKIIFIFWPFFWTFGDCFAVFALLVIFWSWHAFWRF